MLVSKTVFEKVSFDENFTQYGFEDTFFGYQLQQKEIPVSHIDNEMYHDGLDANAVYVDKVMCAIDNLATLYTAQKLPADFVQDSRLLQTYLRCKKVYMAGLIGLVLRLLKRLLRWCATRTSSLTALDLLKLERLIVALK